MSKNFKKEIFTIPNVLSLIRLFLVPVFVWLYIFEENYFQAGIVLLISTLSDFLDGFIARRFNLITDLGKILDPVADKLTQLVVLFSLITNFPLMFYPFIVLLVKEFVSGLLRLFIIYRTELVEGASWHGKVATFFIFLTSLIHVFWGNIPEQISTPLIIISLLAMVLSFILYMYENIVVLKNYYSSS